MVGVTPFSTFYAAPKEGFAYPNMQAATANASTTAREPSESDIVQKHERLIRFVALPFAYRRGAALDDLMQEGRIALLDAARRWRASEGVRLWTYARKFVLGAMFRHVSREASEPAHNAFAGDETVETFLEALQETPESLLEHHECSAIASSQLSELDETERKVLGLRFLESASFSDIAEQLALSSNDRAERIYHGAIGKLRERVGARV